jgi:hypothetical protein
MKYLVIIVVLILLWAYYMIAEYPETKESEIQEIIDKKIETTIAARQEEKNKKLEVLEEKVKEVEKLPEIIKAEESKIAILEEKVKEVATAETKPVTSEKIVEGLDDISGRLCQTCDGLSFGKCIQCFNCAFKAQGYKGKCVSGESIPDKPLESTERWLVNDTFWRSVYATPRTSCALAPFNKD